MVNESSSYQRLFGFLSKTMKTQHVYQPVMLKTLLQCHGRASTRQIAAAFLALDQSQLDYYEIITKRMPGPVLRRHGIVEPEKGGYRFAFSVDDLTDAERADLLALCDAKLAEFLDRRGADIYAHRQTALGDLPGTIRYEVLKRAGSRCELCGVPMDERALQIDHIVPRKHGGKDLIENLQALCWLCNANKGDRDATDFRVVREHRNARQEGCPFCELPPERVVSQNSLAVAFYDRFPVTPLHTLVIPRRHAITWFDLYEPERRSIGLLLDTARAVALQRDPSVTGFNIGMDSGEDAGQTIFHAHVHLIPRRRGDVENPRGGVRGVIPGKADYQP
jgi:diadenosine tetraphosphate (Ap4A) HIT family hydrolase